MNETNPYCAALGIAPPRLEKAKDSSAANFYALLIVALLERGGPLTLAEAAARFAEAGVAPADRALASLKRCKPGRPPIYRDGDLYALDPHDDETDFWLFRLGLRPPRVPLLRVVRPAAAPLPSAEIALSVAEIAEAWRDGLPSNWSAQRAAICVLDAHGGIMAPESVVAFVRARAQYCPLSADTIKFWRHGAAIRAREDGRWVLDLTSPAVRAARAAVRERIAALRRRGDDRPDPEVIRAYQLRREREGADNAARLAAMRRVIAHAFPAAAPQALVLLDVGRRVLETHFGAQIAAAVESLEGYDIIAGVNVRSLLRILGFEPGRRLLAELGPPQKTRQLNRQGRTLRITLELLVQGSCGIHRPFGDVEVLKRYLRDGDLSKLRRRLEADAKSLFALYQYGRTQGALRLRWGFLDEMIPAPWVHPDEPKLCTLKERAHELGVPLEIVPGSAPGWEDPWARARQALVVTEEGRWQSWLVDQQGFEIDDRDVQLARLAARRSDQS